MTERFTFGVESRHEQLPEHDEHDERQEEQEEQDEQEEQEEPHCGASVAGGVAAGGVACAFAADVIPSEAMTKPSTTAKRIDVHPS